MSGPIFDQDKIEIVEGHEKSTRKTIAIAVAIFAIVAGIMFALKSIIG